MTIQNTKKNEDVLQAMKMLKKNSLHENRKKDEHVTIQKDIDRQTDRRHSRQTHRQRQTESSTETEMRAKERNERKTNGR